jgi:DNA polymerase IIIc chi subunit
LAYARQKCYRPATALVTSFLPHGTAEHPPNQQHQIAVHDDDVSAMLDRVAELIGLRVSRRVSRRLAKIS